jgi:predicted lipoprotein with Yx(FWY)xxD motif
MGQKMRHQKTRHSIPVGRTVAAAFAAAGLATSAVAVGTAGTAGASVMATKVTVSTANNAKLGKILVSGKTLYTLSTGNGACDSACLAFWPALMLPKGTTKATAGSGVTASKLGTISRSGGALQVTYNGKALYYFEGDSGPGKVTGNNLKDQWGKWFVVVTSKPTGSSSSSGSSSGSSGSGSSNSGSGGAAF